MRRMYTPILARQQRFAPSSYSLLDPFLSFRSTTAHMSVDAQSFREYHDNIGNHARAERLATKAGQEAEDHGAHTVERCQSIAL
jgi:hypothetical protein